MVAFFVGRWLYWLPTAGSGGASALAANLASRAVAAKAGFVARGKIEHAGLPHPIYRLALA
jgi:RimJ/RimL family protein N-acetyltransferase